MRALCVFWGGVGEPGTSLGRVSRVLDLVSAPRHTLVSFALSFRIEGDSPLFLSRRGRPPAAVYKYQGLIDASNKEPGGERGVGQRASPELSDAGRLICTGAPRLRLAAGRPRSGKQGRGEHLFTSREAPRERRGPAAPPSPGPRQLAPDPRGHSLPLARPVLRGCPPRQTRLASGARTWPRAHRPHFCARRGRRGRGGLGGGRRPLRFSLRTNSRAGTLRSHEARGAAPTPPVPPPPTLSSAEHPRFTLCLFGTSARRTGRKPRTAASPASASRGLPGAEQQRLRCALLQDAAGGRWATGEEEPLRDLPPPLILPPLPLAHARHDGAPL